MFCSQVHINLIPISWASTLKNSFPFISHDDISGIDNFDWLHNIAIQNQSQCCEFVMLAVIILPLGT